MAEAKSITLVRSNQKVYGIESPCCLCIERYITHDNPGYVNYCGHWLCLECHLFCVKEGAPCPICKQPINYVKMDYVGGSQIFCRLPTGKTVIFVVDLKETLVSELFDLIKLKLNEQEKTYPFDLVYNCKRLRMDQKLGEYGIGKDHTIWSIISARGD